MTGWTLAYCKARERTPGKCAQQKRTAAPVVYLQKQKKLWITSHSSLQISETKNWSQGTVWFASLHILCSSHDALSVIMLWKQDTVEKRIQFSKRKQHLNNAPDSVLVLYWAGLNLLEGQMEVLILLSSRLLQLEIIISLIFIFPFLKQPVLDVWGCCSNPWLQISEFKGKLA